jgi:hypothetical protein
MPSALQTYNGYKVWHKEPARDISFSFTEPYKLLGSEFNKRAPYCLSKGTLSLTLEYDQLNVEERKEFIDLFKITKGKLNNFFLRTYICDLLVLETVPDTETTIVVRNTNLSRRYLSSVTGTYLYTPGAYRLPKIIDVVPSSYDPTRELITVDVSFGTTVNAGDYLEYVYFGRLDTDTLSFKMVDIDYSTSSFKFKTVVKV